MLPPRYCVFVSPYARARETLALILDGIEKKPAEIVCDGRIREQEFKAFESRFDWQSKKAEAKARGNLYYRYKNAESGLDAINRVGCFFNQLRLDWLLGNREDTVVIVCHEIVIRCFLTIALDLGPEEFEGMWFKNCEIITLTAGPSLKFSRVEA
jgi:broad specificity phosphatase PhoE